MTMTKTENASVATDSAPPSGSEFRPLEMERLSPGLRVRFNHGKWNPTGRGLELDRRWASRSYAFVTTGTVIEKMNNVPDAHPWGTPPWATPVLTEHGDKTWFRTSSLDVIGFARKTKGSQGEFDLCVGIPNK